MNWNHVPRKVLITGTSGSGKTTLFLAELRAWRCRWKFCFDPEREIARKCAWPVCLDVDELNAAVVAGEPVIFDGAALFPGARGEAFAFFCRYVMNVSRELHGKKLLAADEIQDYQMPGLQSLPPGLAEIMDQGRRHEIDCLFIGQRLNRINDIIRSQLTEIVSFLHDEPLQLDWLAERGFDPEEIRALHCPGEFLKFDRDQRRFIRGWTHAPDATRKGNRASPAGG